ncbi:DUF2059 domain-containing protein [Pseudomonas zhanjiangensis]|uniref:DUF2059 domain-containing protein n=1 Tax=Pseudomonas zhanjiangensis TaxID=3239015 RepID=A0ABV3YRQ9_9PSED
MRALCVVLLSLLSLPSLADTYLQLYQSAGWPQQRAHFLDALNATQERYRGSLPPALYDALVNNSNRRFAPLAMDRRAQQSLRQSLADPAPALAFFQSPLGRKVVAAELLATRSEQLARYANGLPRSEADATRRLLIRHLAQALPAGEAGAEVSLALAGVAADSLSQMMPGLFGGDAAQTLLDSQRQRLVEQIASDLDNTLLHVYRELSDPELEQFVEFAQSSAGQAYYQAALAALRASLAVGQPASSLMPVQGS